MDSYVAPRIQLAVRSINASSGLDAGSVWANFERQEQLGITNSYVHASSRNKTNHEFDLNEETRGYNSDEDGEIPVMRRRFDRQSCSHHKHTSHFVYLRYV